MPLDMALGGWRRLLSVGPEVVGAPVKTQYMVFWANLLRLERIGCVAWSVLCKIKLVAEDWLH